jgi:excisionase family DNA binding protein
MKNNQTFTVPAAARQLGFTLKYIYDLVYSGRMKAEKIAGRWHIPASEVNARMAKKVQQ